MLKGYNVTYIDNLLLVENLCWIFGIIKILLFYKCDINDSHKLDKVFLNNKFDGVIHLAAIVSDPACKLHSDLAIKTNFESNKKIIRNIEECKGV